MATMSSNRRCHAHINLPRTWLGFRELESRKPELQALKDYYSKQSKPDYRIRAAGKRTRWYPLHLDVVRKSTKWFDWCVQNGDEDELILPQMVLKRQIPSLLHFIYTGDYSVDIEDMSQYAVGNSPDGCCTCEQICQLLRVHLAMFQTGLQLGMVELQGLAFSRFRELLNAAPAFVLKFAVAAAYSRWPIEDGFNDFRVHCIKGLMDYRPELVLPAVLRWCGYYRINPTRSPFEANKWLGLQEFAEQRSKFPTFKQHLDYALVLDTVNIPVPSLKFPGRSEPMMSIHRYGCPPPNPHPSTMKRDQHRSNYQYVTYLQPLPFQQFSNQRPANQGPPWKTFPGYGSFGSASSDSIHAPVTNYPVTFDSQTPQATYQTLQPIPEEIDLITSESDSIDYSPMGYAEQPQQVGSPNDFAMMDAPANLPQEGHSSTELPELDLDSILQNAADIDWSQESNWNEYMTDTDFTSLFNNPDTTMGTMNPADLQLPQSTGMEMSTQNDFDFAFAGLPEIDFSGLVPQSPIQTPQGITPMGYTDMNFGNSQPAAWAPETFTRNPSMQSFTVQEPFDWSKAAHSVDPFGADASQTPEAPRRTSRYSLRSRTSSNASTSAEVTHNANKKRSVAWRYSATTAKKPFERSEVDTSMDEPVSELGEAREPSRYSLRSRGPSASAPSQMGPPAKPPQRLSRGGRRSGSQK